METNTDDNRPITKDNMGWCYIKKISDMQEISQTSLVQFGQMV
jgi:hypothetical protein